MGHVAQKDICVTGMLLIKPSWWARAGVGAQHRADRSRA